MKYNFYLSCEEFERQNIMVDDKVLVWSKRFIVSEKSEYHIEKSMAEEGYPAHFHNDRAPYIADPDKRFHGDRGGNGTFTLYAHGVYTVKSIEKIRKDYDTVYKIIINKKDLKKDEA